MLNIFRRDGSKEGEEGRARCEQIVRGAVIARAQSTPSMVKKGRNEASERRLRGWDQLMLMMAAKKAEGSARRRADRQRDDDCEGTVNTVNGEEGYGAT